MLVSLWDVGFTGPGTELILDTDLAQKCLTRYVGLSCQQKHSRSETKITG